MKRYLGGWLGSWLRQSLTPLRWPIDRPPLVLLAVADHFEPFWGHPDRATALERVELWERSLPEMCRGIADESGRPPQHTFFYPLEDYDPEILDRLAGLRQRGLGDVEVHLHHQGDTSQGLSQRLLEFVTTLHTRHGLLRVDPATGRPTYGFIHGNWALDNSLPGGAWCGVNDELRVLSQTGCYADFTLPAYPSPAQTHTINSIYYAIDDPLRPKSHDRGRPAVVGQPPSGDLLLVQGVLTLDWRRRKHGILPRVDNSDLSWSRPPALERLPLWLRFAPVVEGAEQVRFIKLSCHGAPEANHPALLGPQARQFYLGLLRLASLGHFRLRFVTCWEMVQAIHALERGEELI